MTPYAHPGLDTDQHTQTTPITGPGSPSASTNISDTIITAPSDLSSGTIGESVTSQPLSLPVESTDASAPRSTGMCRFTQHKRFFFDDGNITFLVDDVLYRVHRYFFCRDSKVFKTRLSRLPAQEGSSLPVISLEDVKSKDLDAFLSVLYPLDFNALEKYSFEELSSILDLSARWGFASIRDMAIRCLKPPTAHQRLILGRKHGIDQWIFPALQELCERPEPPTRDEARLMGLEDVILVGSVREKVRTHATTANSAGIMDRIKAWGSVEPGERPVRVPIADAEVKRKAEQDAAKRAADRAARIAHPFSFRPVSPTPVFAVPPPVPAGGLWRQIPEPVEDGLEVPPVPVDDWM